MPSPGLTEMATTTQRNRTKPLRVQKVKVKMTLAPGQGSKPAHAAEHVRRVVRSLTGYKSTGKR